FELTMQEEELLNGGSHAVESLGWVAIEAGSGSVGGFSWEAGQTSGVTDADASVALDLAADGVVAMLSSFGGLDTAWARGSGISGTTFEVYAQEDASKDAELVHKAETLDYFAFEGSGVVYGYDASLFV
ncbi:hypothetical protein M4578_23855, partial [Salipiger sp. P9]|uniref:hypothetical protein n=1 Tax=Salipiger pentaromativorans TaxID=2943193 RepID=UPI0021572D8B